METKRLEWTAGVEVVDTPELGPAYGPALPFDAMTFSTSSLPLLSMGSVPVLSEPSIPPGHAVVVTRRMIR